MRQIESTIAHVLEVCFGDGRCDCVVTLCGAFGNIRRLIACWLACRSSMNASSSSTYIRLNCSAERGPLRSNTNR